MPELILPGVYIDERPEGLIVGGPVSVGNIGIVGTASRGPVSKVQILSSVSDAYNTFGQPDPLSEPNPRTLVRALQLAYNNGASTVMAVRVVETGAGNPIPGTTFTTPAAWATHPLAVAGGGHVELTASGPGTWANATLKAGPGTWTNGLTVQVQTVVSGPTKTAKVTITYYGSAAGVASAVETYMVTSGTALVSMITASSNLVTAAANGNISGLPDAVAETAFATNGADADAATPGDYANLGFVALLQADAQIIVAAGLDITQIGQQLKAHVEQASSDTYKSERIGVVGSPPGANVAAVLGEVVPSERIVFVAPGILFNDANGAPATLSGAYTAAAVAGLISSLDPQASPTNKTLTVDGLETRYNSGQLQQLVEGTVLAVEQRGSGDFRVVKGISTDITGAFSQITTRRIVDLARKNVRASADPYIGLLNNDRVRGALRTTIAGALDLMVAAEQLETYTLDVTATRAEEIRGIAQVVMTLQPTFSIDYIQVTMYLQ